MIGKPPKHLLNLVCINGLELRRSDRRAFPPVAVEHLALRCDHFIETPPHQDHPVRPIHGK